MTEYNKFLSRLNNEIYACTGAQQAVMPATYEAAKFYSLYKIINDDVNSFLENFEDKYKTLRDDTEKEIGILLNMIEKLADKKEISNSVAWTYKNKCFYYDVYTISKINENEDKYYFFGYRANLNSSIFYNKFQGTQHQCFEYATEYLNSLSL